MNLKRLPPGVILALLLMSGWARGQDCYIVSAGVDNYENAGRLNGCLGDARNTFAAFRAQQGRAFGRVHGHLLLDDQASRAGILGKFQEVSRQSQPGDFVVLFLSGHGARTNNNQTWYFLPHDFDPQDQQNSTLTDRDILAAADRLATQGRKVVIIVDACFAGQLRLSASRQLNNYRDPQGGGLILMLSSSPNQTSSALGQYSAFAKAFADSMNGNADLNSDGRVTLQELRKYSYEQTYQLLRQRRLNGRQDSEVTWSPSISEQLTLASNQQFAGNRPVNPQPTIPRPLDSRRINPQPVPQPVIPQPTKRPDATQPAQFVGNESLAGYGHLIFRLDPNGRAVMIDAKATSHGTWQRRGQQLILRFDNGRITYSGTLAGTTLRGSASNGRTTWSFNVREQKRTFGDDTGVAEAL